MKLNLILLILLLALLSACSTSRISPCTQRQADIPNRPTLPKVIFTSPDDPNAIRCVDVINLQQLYKREVTLITHIDTLEIIIGDLSN